MSISTVQRNRKIKEFSMSLIQRGVEPNNYELNKMLTEYFDNHIMGMPYYSPKKQIPYETSSKDDYNHNFLSFEEDINTIYLANVETNNKAVSLQEYYDTEKDKINNSIDKLTQRVDNLSDIIRSSVRTQEYVEVFDDLYRIEFYGNKSRNIPATTSFVDLLQKKVCNEKTNAQVNRMSLENAVCKLEGLYRFSGYETKGDLQKVLEDTITDIFILAAKSDDNTEKSIDLFVDMGQLIDINSVVFSYTSSRNMQCTLSISDNGNDFYSVYDIYSRGHVEWNFTHRKIRYLKITCLKPEADGIQQTTNAKTVYEYYYIFKNLYVALEGYDRKSILVTKPITFPNLTSQIKLDVTDMVFNNTRIDYFIGFDNGTRKIGWDAIRNHEEFVLNMFQKRYDIANSGTYDDYGVKSDLTGLSAIFKLPLGTNLNSLKVVPGYNMWAVNRYTPTGGATSDDLSLESIDLTEYINKCQLTRFFMDCENYDSFVIKPNCLYIFTQYINMPETNTLFDKTIKLTNSDYTADIENAQIRIFTNGYECCAAENGLYSFRLKKGTNKVQIVVYFEAMSTDEGLYDAMLYHNINFKAFTNDVFGWPPMRYAETNVLAKMVEDNYLYYTVRNRVVYVKNDPNDIIRYKKEDMGYFLSYYSLKEDMMDYYSSDQLTFRIMAILSSSDKNVSPSIQALRVTGK